MEGPLGLNYARKAGMECCEDVIEELRGLGSPSIKKVLLNHGAREPFFGVKISDLKPIEKRLKPNCKLALELYATGISDAMYLAGLITDDKMMTRDDLQSWVDAAYWSLLSESTVPWVAAGSDHGRDLAVAWIESPVETTACAGWLTFSTLTLIRPDAELDLPEYAALLERVRTSIHEQPNRVRYSMNGFVIACGSNVKALTDLAAECAAEIGEVRVMMGDTACKVPFAPDCIAEAVEKGLVGKKRKTAKC
ncbi:MAG TPA: DNA alkylation repair protein [Fimbriimonadaceae bacterium]|nr:DNA alkylation repair protein [Fimbriimonadaceae bacterium]